MTERTKRKPLFDFVRRMVGRPIRQSEVETLDCMLDGGDEDCLQDTVTGVTGSPASDWKVSQKGVSLIQHFEGCAKRRVDGMVEAYPDPGTGDDPWTIGWGATGKDRFNGGNIKRGTVWTQAQCDARLEEDLLRYASDVAQALGDTPTTQSQFDALVSFHYNTGAIAKATLTRKHKAGDHAGAAREFDRWCYAGGRVLKGLARRRAAEATLYRTPE
ncbi:lysozyme [Aurantiacibacter sp. D1-12]|uniref:lysozyme n=1 Tax=Aurantiacibacter sp. D1-12 TaxID=2993658 RepID=UPI00237C8ECC|nr:lysozyme [Aurantiacibacter sp. D1-12]MDE1466985.1 lysozyme [Aurantiacibacter sp. D1-12]